MRGYSWYNLQQSNRSLPSIMNQLTRHTRRWLTDPLFIVLLSLIFIVPQIFSQLTQDHLPATGDMVHKRIVYLLTNFPNFPDAPELILSHSQFYHRGISYINILTGLTGDQTFYGFGIINLLLLPISLGIVFMCAKKIQTAYAWFAPLLVATNQLLMFPFFGQANQHLIYIFVPCFLFVIFNFKTTPKTIAAALLLLGGAFNSSVTIWLPLVIILIILERYYPSYRPLLLGVCSILIYIPFIRGPLSYLVFGDVYITVGSLIKIISILGFGIIFLLILYQFLWKKSWVYPSFIVGILCVVLFFFLAPRAHGPFSANVQSKAQETAKISFQSASFLNYVFAINPNKNIAGSRLFVPMVILLLSLAIHTRSYREKDDSRALTALHFIILAPLCMTLIQFLLLKFNFDTFVTSPLYKLHPARLMALSFSLFPLALLPHLPSIRKSLPRAGFSLLTCLFLFNSVSISSFFYGRVYRNWTQKSYQEMLQTSLEKGIGENLTTPEAAYSAYFYHHIELKGSEDIRR